MEYYLHGNRTTKQKFETYVNSFRLVDGGPEFEVVRPPAPTYEQAIVHMYREAKSIVEVGEKLKSDMLREQVDMRETRTCIDGCRRGVMQHPNGSRYHNSWNGPLRSAQKRFVELLDRVHSAQEKYKAWAATYGDI